MSTAARRPPAAAVVAALVAALGAVAIRSAPSSAQEGPSIILDRTDVHPGEEIAVSMRGFTSQQVTVAVCGNLAKLGSADCNMPAAQSERIRQGQELTLTGLTAQPPPVPCPCIVLAYSPTNDEFAVASINLIGHPSGPVVDPADGPLVEVEVAARRTGGGIVDSLRSSLGGPTRYAVTVSVRNVTTVMLANVVLSGSARHRLNDDAATLDLDRPPPIAPGQTWEQTVVAELPAPMIGRYTWTVVSSGAGSTVQSTGVSSHTPVLLILVTLAAVADLAAILWRRRRRSRRAVSEAEPAAELAHPAPSSA